MISTIAYPYPIHIHIHINHNWFRNFDDIKESDMDRYRQSPGMVWHFCPGLLSNVWRKVPDADLNILNDERSHITGDIIKYPDFPASKQPGKMMVKTTKPMIPYDLIFLSRLSIVFPGILLFFGSHPSTPGCRGPTPRRAWTWARLVHLPWGASFLDMEGFLPIPPV
jgi:hypothetical protein